jgi:type IV pilus assembly protein PilO
VAAESALARLPFPAKLGIIVAAVALVGVAYWVVFYGDIAQNIASARKQETALKGTLAEAKKAQVAYQKDLAELHEREERRAEVEKVLPSQAQYPSFLSSVQSVADLSGVKLTAWDPESEVQEEFYARVPMKLRMKGKFHQIAKFFYSVSQLDRIINMEDIAIMDARSEGDDVVVQCSALATAFRSLAEAKGKPTKRSKKRRGKRK